MEGVAQLVGALNGIKARVTTEAVEEILLRDCQPVADAMEAAAPRLTGEAAETIAVRILEPTTPGVVTAGIGPSRDAFYLRFAEFGSAHQGARPWARPAWDTEEPALQARLKASFGALITGGGL